MARLQVKASSGSLVRWQGEPVREGRAGRPGQGWRLGLIALLSGLLFACSGPGGEGSDAGLEVDSGSELPDARAEYDAVASPDAAPQAWVRIASPEEGAEVENPVTIRWSAGDEVVTVTLAADGWPLHEGRLAADLGEHQYSFSGVGYERSLLITGHDAEGQDIATASVRFTVSPPPLVFPVDLKAGLQLSLFDDPFSTASFGAARANGRLHAGCDLYFTPDGGSYYQTSYYPYNQGTPILAVADGVILAYYAFYQGTHALEVDHGDFVVRYGEVHSGGLPGGLGVGSPVTAGQEIATMGDLAMTSGTWAMLHFELFSGALTGSLTNASNTTYLHVPDGNYQRRGDLMDCRPFLRALLE